MLRVIAYSTSASSAVSNPRLMNICLGSGGPGCGASVRKMTGSPSGSETVTSNQLSGERKFGGPGPSGGGRASRRIVPDTGITSRQRPRPVVIDTA